MIIQAKKAIGIVSYGAKIPRFKISGETVAAAQGKAEQKIYKSLGVESKTVPGRDEDTITLSTASGFQALERLQLLHTKQHKVRDEVGSLFIGSESHPYAVKPTGTVVAEALGIASDSVNGKVKPLALADLQFACKAGTQALQTCAFFVNTQFSHYAMAIGTDTAQAKPGDVLEYTAGAGSAAFILGPQGGNGESASKNKLLAKLLATTSVATDTPDFWRRPYQSYPEHAGRFTADPGYFLHIKMAAQLLLEETQLQASDFEYCIFHSPNAKFPQQVAKELGFSQEQVERSLLVTQIGNTYAASSLLGLVNTLDYAQASKKILVVSYGSGSGSDAFVFETTEYLVEARKKWEAAGVTPGAFVSQQLQILVPVTYEEYRANSTH